MGREKSKDQPMVFPYCRPQGRERGETVRSGVQNEGGGGVEKVSDVLKSFRVLKKGDSLAGVPMTWACLGQRHGKVKSNP